MQMRDSLLQPRTQAGVDARRQRREVVFGGAQRRFGGRAVAAALQRRLFHLLEVSHQRPGVLRGDQPRAGAAAGDEHGRAGAEQAGGDQAKEAAHPH